MSSNMKDDLDIRIFDEEIANEVKAQNKDLLVDEVLSGNPPKPNNSN